MLYNRLVRHKICPRDVSICLLCLLSGHGKAPPVPFFAVVLVEGFVASPPLSSDPVLASIRRNLLYRHANVFFYVLYTALIW